MANDSTHAGQISSEQDATPVNDSYFTDHEGEGDAFFGPEQLAQAQKVVPVPPDQNVIRVQVNPGEILELSSPFDAGAQFLAREADGNLAIKVGDVTVILLGYVAANDAAPVVIETSDGQPIDIATLLASTDPAIDIQTAAGPGDAGQGGQGADNTGAILAQLAAGNGLGGLNAVGTQDQTQLAYGLIDNAIRLDREDALLAPTTATPFRGLSEPFLRDPVHQGAFMSFDKFITKYDQYVTNHPGKAWADFEGTQATGDDFQSYLSQTSFTSEVAHSSTDAEYFRIDKSALEAFLHDPAHPITSDGSELKVVMRDDDTTAFVLRKSDNALVLVFHLHAVDDPDAASGTGNFQIDSYLIDRLDHPEAGNDILSLDIPYQIFVPAGQESPENPMPEETIVGSGSASVDVLDDIPVVGQTDYYSFLHACSYKDALACFDVLTHGKISDNLLTHDAGQVDEDYIFGGNRDKDNASGPDVDEARGDTIGDRFVVGQIHVNFGADGASGAIPHGDHFWEPDGDPIFTDANPQALAIAGYAVGSTVPGLTSQGHELIVLKHETIGTIEVVQVGYHSDALPAFARASESGDTVVFTLLLQTGPNLPLIPFGGFVFEQCQPLDHPVAGTLESNLQLLFPIIATDDDGDHPVDPLNIVINVNDDAPTFQITYSNEDPNNARNEFAASFSPTGGGDHFTTKDFGHVDEDWLQGGISNDGIALANGPGNRDLDGQGNSNADQDGDDRGGLDVCGWINLKYGADGPAAGDTGKLGLDVFTVGSPFVNGDGSTLTSDGKPLVVLESDSSHLLVGVPGFTVGTGEGQIQVKDQPVFCLDLDPKSGKFEFHLLGAIDHANAPGQDPESNLLLSFNAGSATDFDGDPAAAVIKIQVNDDKPEIDTSYQSYASEPADYNNPIYTTNFALIDEDWVRDSEGNQIGNKDEDNASGNEDATSGDTKGTAHADGRITVAYGGDGVGTAAPFAFTAKEGDAVQVKDDHGNPIPLKTDTGNTVFVHLLADGGSGSTRLEGFSNPDDSNTFVEGTSTKVFSVSLYPNGGQFQFALLQPVLHPDTGKEDNLFLSIGVSAGTDGDGDPALGSINIRINDDAPQAMKDSQDFDGPDPETGDVHGNVLANDKKGADVYVAFVSNINGPNNLPNGVEIDNGGGQTLAGMNGYLTIYANGDYHYTPNTGGDLPGPGDDTFTYTLKDADGDTSTATLSFHYTGGGDAVIERAAFVPSGPTHTVADSYDLNLTTYSSTDATKDKGYHPGDTVEINDSSILGLTIFGAASHTLKGGSGDDHIMGNAGDDNLQGRGGNDILEGGDGRDELHGGAGDDTLFGGNNDDSLYGDAGHDAMSGGAGNDTFHDVDADDLDGTNTLDGFHTIDGGDGFDTVDISGLKSFDASQALRLENVEHLALDGTAAGGGGTTVTLNYDAAYGITQVGGLHAFNISGDKADAVHLQGSGGNVWAEIGNTHVYEAGIGASKVTVTVDQDVAVQLS